MTAGEEMDGWWRRGRWRGTLEQPARKGQAVGGEQPSERRVGGREPHADAPGVFLSFVHFLDVGCFLRACRFSSRTMHQRLSRRRERVDAQPRAGLVAPPLRAHGLATLFYTPQDRLLLVVRFL